MEKRTQLSTVRSDGEKAPAYTACNHVQCPCLMVDMKNTVKGRWAWSMFWLSTIILAFTGMFGFALDMMEYNVVNDSREHTTFYLSDGNYFACHVQNQKIFSDGLHTVALRFLELNLACGPAFDEQAINYTLLCDNAADPQFACTETLSRIAHLRERPFAWADLCRLAPPMVSDLVVTVEVPGTGDGPAHQETKPAIIRQFCQHPVDETYPPLVLSHPLIALDNTGIFTMMVLNKLVAILGLLMMMGSMSSFTGLFHRFAFKFPAK